MIYLVLSVLAVIGMLFFWWIERRADSNTGPQKVLVGFWVRLLSDTLDALLLGIFGSMFFFLKPIFETLGEKGWWVGLIITFLYTGISQSSFGDGQSLAKRLLRIQVIKRDGSFMSLPESFIRYLVLALIAYGGWILNGLMATSPSLRSEGFRTAFSILQMICFIGVVFLVPFHSLKQGLHDLLVDTIVVRKGTFTPEKIDALRDVRRDKRAYIIFGMAVFLIIGLANVSLFWTQSEFTTLMPKLSQYTRQVEEGTSFQNIGIKIQPGKGSDKKSDLILISAFLPDSLSKDKEFLKSEAQKAVDLFMKDPPIRNDYVIFFEVRSGFNIGITSFYSRQTFQFSSSENGKVAAMPVPAKPMFPEPSMKARV